MTAIQPDDLDAAVAAGILPEANAEALRIFVAERHRTPARFGMEDERFRFMRGFNDFFFAIGILLLGAASIFFTGFDPVYCLAAAAFMWALSELLVRRMRLVLPGILLSVLFVFFTYQAVPTNMLVLTNAAITMRNADPLDALRPVLLGMSATAMAVTIKALMAAAIAGLYYWRFRLPFTVLLIAASLVLAVFAAVLSGVCERPARPGRIRWYFSAAALRSLPPRWRSISPTASARPAALIAPSGCICSRRR